MNYQLDAEASISIHLSDSHIGCSRFLQINDEKIELKIPAGIRDGQKLRVRGKGNFQPASGRRGDLYIVVRVLGAAYNISTSPAVERDTTYQNSHAVTREVLGKSVDNKQLSTRSPGTYRYQGKRIVESILNVDKPKDTTYRNSGAGTKEKIARSKPGAKTNTNSASRPGSKKASSQGQVNNTTSSANQISEPIEGLDNFIGMVREGYAFQVRDVLERIVNTERERIENERGLWKLGAGVAALAFGVSIDGFDAGDLLAGWTFSNIGGVAHQVASKEQIEFLKKLQSEWLVLDRSPMDIRRRLGEPQGRFIGISRANILDMFNIHQSGSRGFHLVELDHAGNIARGFQDPQSLEVLQRSYDEEDVGIISSHLYPSAITPLKLCRTITPGEAMKKDPYYSQLSKAGAPFRVVYSDNTEGVMYKIQIPQHSDY